VDSFFVLFDRHLVVIRRRTLLKTLPAVGAVSLAGCTDSQDDQPGSNSDDDSDSSSSSAAAVVETYYTAAAGGNLGTAAGKLAMTQLDSEGDGQSVDQLITTFQNKGMSKDGAAVSLGEFTELSVAEFAEFTLKTEGGETRQPTEQQIADILPAASAFGGEEEPVRLVHHSGGFLPEIWVPYQPTEPPADGWGEVIIEVGSYEGELFLIGDFRTYTDLKVVES
jgi:hypothetical protein